MTTPRYPSARLARIEGWLKLLEREVEQLKAQGTAGWPRLDGIERDLRDAEKELSLLQGQAKSHGFRLDGIERTLNELRTESQGHYEKLDARVMEGQHKLDAHAAEEDKKMNKVLLGIVSILLTAIVGFMVDFFVKHSFAS